jgi:excisionase family DNA binding protein
MYKDKELQDNKLNINTLLKSKDVAEILNISRSKAYYLMQIGEIPTVKIGQCRRVRPEDLMKYIESNIYSVNPYFE